MTLNHGPAGPTPAPEAAGAVQYIRAVGVRHRQGRHISMAEHRFRNAGTGGQYLLAAPASPRDRGLAPVRPEIRVGTGVRPRLLSDNGSTHPWYGCSRSSILRAGSGGSWGSGSPRGLGPRNPGSNPGEPAGRRAVRVRGALFPGLREIPGPVPVAAVAGRTDTSARGGTGRRAGLRGQCPRGREGPNPSGRT